MAVLGSTAILAGARGCTTGPGWQKKPVPTSRSKNGAGPCSQWSTKDLKYPLQEERAPVQGAERFRDGEAVTCRAQPATRHQFLPTSTAGASKASSPPSNQHFTPTRAITVFQSPKAGRMGAVLSAACQQPSLILVLPLGSSTGPGAGMEDGAGSARLGSALVHSPPLPPCHHLNPDRIKSFQLFRKETLGTALKLSCWREPIKLSHSSSFIDC